VTFNVKWLSELKMSDIEQVGGKNASLGELISNLASAGVRVPGGFATSATAFREFLATDGLGNQIELDLKSLNTDDVVELARVGELIRGRITNALLPKSLESDIRKYFEDLEASSVGELSWAVRSSATAEDLPEASFAGQQETFLNIRGIENLLAAIKLVFASLYNDRAIAYRVHHGFNHSEVALSVGIQRMVRSDKAASGVIFTIDTESGFENAIFITSSYGLGEAVVQGAVNPDEFYVYKQSLSAGRPAILKRALGEKALKMIFTQDQTVGKTIDFVDVDKSQRGLFSITDDEVSQLAQSALAIEQHYGRPMDIEWAKDGLDGQLYILQARPETVNSRRTGGTIERYTIATPGVALIEGRAIGQKVGAGPVAILTSIDQMHKFEPGSVLVADMTDPDWEPIMKRASAIVTNRGGRTCHAAIIARELGIPAIVGTLNATTVLDQGSLVTVSCAQGDTGVVFEGELEYRVESSDSGKMPEIPVKIMMNVGNPDQAFAFSRIPNSGVGLARVEFIINRQIGIHPQALSDVSGQSLEVQTLIEDRISAYPSAREFYVSRLAEGISMIAAAFSPEPVIVRMSDFKSNEYANLIGGDRYEPDEENPMIGFRGASRYLSEDFKEAFEMECEALVRARNEMGLTNLKIMIPFVRTPAEGKGVVELLASNGLVKGESGLEIYMMCELPSNALLADDFLDIFDGFSIGSNDLTQLTLGLDRDSALVAGSFDERDPAVKKLMQMAISACKARGKYVGICGQGPSDHPDLALWLLEQGIDTISLNPDTVLETWMSLGKTNN
jgi:pyruvate,water dikinase